MRINSIMSTYSVKGNSANLGSVAKNVNSQQKTDSVSFGTLTLSEFEKLSMDFPEMPKPVMDNLDNIRKQKFFNRLNQLTNKINSGTLTDMTGVAKRVIKNFYIKLAALRGKPGI